LRLPRISNAHAHEAAAVKQRRLTERAEVVSVVEGVARFHAGNQLDFTEGKATFPIRRRPRVKFPAVSIVCFHFGIGNGRACRIGQAPLNTRTLLALEQRDDPSPRMNVI
jgi:hypothetical protein